MTKKHLLVIVLATSFFFSCNNYLNVVPKNDVQTIETIFEKREDAATWLKTCYTFLIDPIATVVINPAYVGTDEVVAGDYLRLNKEGTWWDGLFIADGLQMVQNPYGNIWKKDQFYAGIRYCNIFLQNIHRVYNMEDDEKTLWAAEVKALKAHMYFELMRRYGPIVLVPENIETNSAIEDMQQPRSPIDTCVKAIVNLLDEAIQDLPPLREKEKSRYGFYSLEAAWALKANVLLYAASPIFNGNTMYANFKNKDGVQLVSQEYDKEKWHQAAITADSAIQICLHYGKGLIEGEASKATPLLNTMMDIENSVLARNFENKEALLMLRTYGYDFRWYSWVLPYIKDSGEDDNDLYGSGLYGCIAPSIKMVEMYYTEHGLPIDEDNEWDLSLRYKPGRETNPSYRGVVSLDEDVLQLHLRREPRFYAHIAADRCYWQRGKGEDHNYVVRPYLGEAFGSAASTINNSVPQNLTGYWMKKHTYSDVSNFDYEEQRADIEEGYIIFRLAELYLIAAEAWNEYLDVPDDRVWDPLNVVRERAGIPDVKTSWENYSNTPTKVTTKIGMRQIIRDEWNVEFAFEGRRFWNLRRWLTAGEELNDVQLGWNILGDDAQGFYNNYDGPIVVWNKRKFLVPRDYLFPLRSEEVIISGCVQNPGW